MKLAAVLGPGERGQRDGRQQNGVVGEAGLRGSEQGGEEDQLGPNLVQPVRHRHDSSRHQRAGLVSRAQAQKEVEPLTIIEKFTESHFL